MKTVGLVFAPLVAFCLLSAPLPPAAAQAGASQTASQAAAYIARGDAAVSANDTDGAIRAFRQALAIAPNDGLAQQHLAETYVFKGQPDQAVAAYRALLSPAPGQSWDASANTPLALARFSVYLLQMGQWPEALANYQRAAALLNQSVGKPKGLELALPDLGDGPGQAAYTPDVLEGMARLAAGLAVPGYDEPQVRWALAKAPTSSLVLFYLGKVLYAQQGAHSQEAKTMLTAAAALAGPQGDAPTEKAANALLKLLH